MKHGKILGLLAVVGAALMALAVSARATTVTTTTGGGAATPTIHLVNENGHVQFVNPLLNVACASTIEGTFASHGSGVTAAGNVSSLLFTSCTNSWHVTAVTNGALEVHWSSGHNGTLTSSGAKIDTTRLGVTCVYETNNTSLGSLTGGNPATLRLEGKLPLNLSESSGLCGSGNTPIEGSYVTTSALYVAP